MVVTSCKAPASVYFPCPCPQLSIPRHNCQQCPFPSCLGVLRHLNSGQGWL